MKESLEKFLQAHPEAKGAYFTREGDIFAFPQESAKANDLMRAGKTVMLYHPEPKGESKPEPKTQRKPKTSTK